MQARAASRCARLLQEPALLVVRARGADHVAALDPGDLGGDGADRAGCGGDEDLLAVLQSARFQETAIGRDPGAAQGVHVDAEGQLRVRIEHLDATAVAVEPFGEALTVPDDVALPELRVTRLHDPADAAAGHGLAQLLVGVEARPHVGIHREDQPLDLDFALAGVGNPGFNDGEVLGNGNPAGAADEMNLAGDGHWRFLCLKPR